MKKLKHIEALKQYSKDNFYCTLLIASLFIIGLSFTIVTQRPILLSYIDSQGIIQPVKTKAEWQIKRRQILDRMQEVMGPLPDRSILPPLRVKYKDSIKGGSYERYTIDLTVAANENVPAYLYVPIQKGTMKKLPAMLALHPTGPMGKKIVDGQSIPDRAYAKELAERGYVVIAPDYPDFGDLKNYDFKTDRYVSGTMKSIFDDMRCVDFLQARSDVDPTRIGVIGHSLGGHSAMFVGAFDKRLKVVVSSCGWTLFHYYFNGDASAAKKNGGRLWPWAQQRYMPLVDSKYHLDPDKVPFDFDEVIAAIAPRAFFSSSALYDANFNVRGVRVGIARASKVYSFLGAKNALAVYYPPSKHDFPPRARHLAYRFIDSVFGVNYTPYSYLDNSGYSSRVAQFAKDKSQQDIVMLGDSRTSRTNWNKLLGRTDVANRGIGSDITAGYIHRLKYVFDLSPKICFIEGGVNDLARYIPIKTIIQNLGILIDTLRQKKITPVLNAVTLVTDNYRYISPVEFNRQIKKLDAAIKNLAERKKVMLIDLNPMLTDGNFLLKKYAVSDGIHFTRSAYLIWKSKIVDALAKFN